MFHFFKIGVFKEFGIFTCAISAQRSTESEFNPACKIKQGPRDQARTAPNTCVHLELAVSTLTTHYSAAGRGGALRHPFINAHARAGLGPLGLRAAPSSSSRWTHRARVWLSARLGCGCPVPALGIRGLWRGGAWSSPRTSWAHHCRGPMQPSRPSRRGSWGRDAATLAATAAHQP